MELTYRGVLGGLVLFLLVKPAHAVFIQPLTGPTSQNYGAAVDATHAKKAKL